MPKKHDKMILNLTNRSVFMNKKESFQKGAAIALLMAISLVTGGGGGLLTSCSTDADDPSDTEKTDNTEQPGTQNPGTTTQNKLTIKNCPSGTASVMIYASSTMPTTFTEYTAIVGNTDNALGSATGKSSPLTIEWLKSNHTGNYLVILTLLISSETVESRIGVVAFDANGCGTVDYTSMKDSLTLGPKLTIQNFSGQGSVVIYTSSTMPTTKTETDSMCKSANAIGTGFGSSPITISWTNNNHAGRRLINITGTGTGEIYLQVVNFDANGNGTADFNTMVKFSSLPY
jgi:hypothetical protein